MRHRLTSFALLAGCLAAAPGAQAQATAPDTSWVARSALYEVFVQDFSPEGNFRGVIAGLDRIQAAGANVVWLMPIFPIGVVNRKGTLGSPYAVTDYRAINPSYGAAADLRALIDAVHGRGMKLILDWVPDHTAPDHPWVRDHPDYYFRDAAGMPSVPRDEKGKLTDWTDVVQLDYGNPAVRRAMIGEMRYWLDGFGIDGFRADVAGFLPYDFWKEAIAELRSAVPRRLLFLAEWSDPEIHRTGFDLTYAWESRGRLIKVWQGGPAASFADSEAVELRNLPPGARRMRFTTNHDQTAWEAPPVDIFKGDSGARAAFVATALLPGRPLLYNGQEVDSPQKLPLFERELVQWDQPDASAARAFYQRIVQLATTEPGLMGFDFHPVRTSAPDDLIAFRRGDLVVLVNPRTRPVHATVSRAEISGARDLLSNRVQRGGTVNLPAYGAMVLKRAAR
jgi:glycosidase